MKIQSQPVQSRFPDHAPVAHATEPVCFHCALPVPSDVRYAVMAHGKLQPVCCAGCQAVASAILGQGLGDYYRLRDAAAETAPQDAVAEDLTPYDDPEIQRSFVRTVDGASEALLLLEGIRCSACVWLNEQVISRIPGVLSANVNYATHRAQIRWDKQRVNLSSILEAIRAIGYRAHPYDPGRIDLVWDKEQRQAIGRLFVAGLGMMQVGMYAVPAYLAEGADMSWDIEQLFRWAGLALTLPVMLYSAGPFFRGAIRDLMAHRVGMDVPVALGLAIAFGASLVSTVSGGRGPVYYDSIAMFVCLLLLGRYFELVARRRATQALQHLGRLVPEFAERVPGYPDSTASERVPAAALRPGEHVIVSTGQQVPADGFVLSGTSAVDESLLSGEARPVRKTPGDTLTGGSINLSNPLVMRVAHAGADTVLSGITRMVERATGERHRLAVIADRAAGIFILSVLALSCIAGAYWATIDSEKAIWVAVSVLVATCPCALSLATPVALTAATGELARRGFVVTRARALEWLARSTDMVLDKTGTVTCGELSLLELATRGRVPTSQCLRIAAALERGSTHPVASAIRKAAARADLEIPAAEGVESHTGEGVAAMIDGQPYRLGSPGFVAGLCGGRPALADGGDEVILADRSGVLAVLKFGDELRPDAVQAVAVLKQAGLRLHLVTGDAERPARDLASKLGIDSVLARSSPEGKRDYVRDLQGRGAVVVMVGDGINDAPVLAQADVAVAMGGGAHLAQAQGDAVLLSGRLLDLAWAVRHARKSLWVIRQNIAWAFAYNLVVLPFAFAGVVAPWAAAIGMSCSSLLVVLNALRLVGSGREQGSGKLGRLGIAAA